MHDVLQPTAYLSRCMLQDPCRPGMHPPQPPRWHPPPHPRHSPRHSPCTPIHPPPPPLPLIPSRKVRALRGAQAEDSAARSTSPRLGPSGGNHSVPTLIPGGGHGAAWWPAGARGRVRDLRVVPLDGHERRRHPAGMGPASEQGRLSEREREREAQLAAIPAGSPRFTDPRPIRLPLRTACGQSDSDTRGWHRRWPSPPVRPLSTHGQRQGAPATRAGGGVGL